jgi:hypothetical protein
MTMPEREEAAIGLLSPRSPTTAALVPATLAAQAELPPTKSWCPVGSRLAHPSWHEGIKTERLKPTKIWSTSPSLAWSGRVVLDTLPKRNVCLGAGAAR